MTDSKCVQKGAMISNTTNTQLKNCHCIIPRFKQEENSSKLRRFSCSTLCIWHQYGLTMLWGIELIILCMHLLFFSLTERRSHKIAKILRTTLKCITIFNVALSSFVM